MYRYVNPRKAEWPEADYIVGNPPFVGNWRMRAALGHGYVDALRSTYPQVPENVDYVLYWWHVAAELAKRSMIEQFGLITTNSFRQRFGRQVAEHHLKGSPRLHLTFAIPDHPWVDSADGAAVRIAMTAAAPGEGSGRLCHVIRETPMDGDTSLVELSCKTGLLNADLTIGVDVGGVSELVSNSELASPGVKLHGAGFLVSPEDAEQLGLGRLPGLDSHLKPYLSGRDLTKRPRGLMVIDLFGLEPEDIRSRFPEVYQWVSERVKPERDQNNRESYRRYWWIFGEPRSKLRPALETISRYIATPETSKHRFFVFLDGEVLPDNMLVVIPVESAEILSILSSRIHTTWALAAGGTLEDRPRYNKTVCFDNFPFPLGDAAIEQRLTSLGDNLDRSRKRQLEQYPNLTITGMYNVLEKLRSDEELTEKDKEIHEKGLVSVLKQIHDELDAAVFDAYGWPHDLTDEEILERLVALNAERAEEESRGIIRWLRPEFQNPEGVRKARQEQLAGLAALGAGKGDQGPGKAAKAAKKPWPKDFPSRLTAVRDEFTDHTPLDLPTLAKRFRRARPDQLTETLDSLESLGLLISFGEPKQWKAPR